MSTHLEPQGPRPAHGLPKQMPVGSDAAQQKRLWPISARRTSEGWKIHVDWVRLSMFAVVAGAAAWSLAATAAFAFVKYQRGYTDVRFGDIVLLPFRWEQYQVGRGEFYVKGAKKELENAKYREAFYNLRVGVSKAPANKEGRILLAQFYGIWKRPDLAEQVLLQGLRYNRDDIEYLKPTLTFLLRQQRDAKVLELTREMLAEGGSQNPVRDQLLALASATASYFRGNYDQAEELLRSYKLEATRDGRLIAARIAWERGEQAAAFERLRQLAEDFPKDEEIYAQTGSYLRELGRFTEARRESFLRSLKYPADPQAKIDLLYAYKREGDTGSLTRGIEEIFREFATNPAVLMALADFAANTGDTSLASRIYDLSKSANLDWERAAMMTVESRIVAKQYPEALELVRQLLRENPDWAKRFYSVFNGLQAIAHYGLGDAESAQVFLNNYLNQNTVRADDLIAVSNRLSAVGARAQARQVLVQATKTDPLNQPALTNLVKLDVELGNADTLTANVRKLLGMRKPARDVLDSAYRKLGSDVFLFAPDRSVVLQELRTALDAHPARG